MSSERANPNDVWKNYSNKGLRAKDCRSKTKNEEQAHIAQDSENTLLLFTFCHACSWRGEGSIPQPSTIIGHRHRWCPQHRAKPWVLDIDASNHMTSSRAGFVDLDQDRAFQRWLHHSHRGARSRSVLFSCKNGEHRSLSLHSLPHAAPHSQYNQHRIAR